MSTATEEQVTENTGIKIPDRLECQCDKTLCAPCFPCPRPVDGEDMLCQECREAPEMDRDMTLLQRMRFILSDHHCHPTPKEWAAQNA